MIIWNEITRLSSQLRELESQQRHGDITPESYIELIWELTSQIYEILDNEKYMKPNIWIVADEIRNNLCYVQGNHLNRYKNWDFDTQEGLRIMVAHVDQQVIDIIGSQDVLDNQIIFQQILMWNLNSVEDIVK